MTAVMIERNIVTQGLLQMLRNPAASGGTGKYVYDNTVTGKTPSFPHAILYSLPGGMLDGPFLTGPEVDADLQYQIKSVGKSPAQAEWMADKVRATMIGRDTQGRLVAAFPAPSGWVCSGRFLASPVGGTESTGSAPNQLFEVNETYTVQLTPGP